MGAAAAAELLLGAFCMKMAAPTASKAASLGCNNKPTFPELDFRSGARVEELNKLIQEFTKHDQREYDDQRALEIHTAKDFIFSMLGKEEKKKGGGGSVRVMRSGVENLFLPSCALFAFRFPSRSRVPGLEPSPFGHFPPFCAASPAAFPALLTILCAGPFQALPPGFHCRFC